VTVFLDTSVLIAASRISDERHVASFDLIRACSSETAAAAAHTMAEFYASLTGIRPPHRFHPVQALTLLNQFHKRLRWIELSADEVLDATGRVAALGLLGGIIYDALLLQCARKVGAELIYTWNVRHFQLVAPDLAEKIVRP
jgi:predicted nucleic acid-binding protein